MNPHNVPQNPLLRGPVALSHLMLRQFVRQGDRGVDATCGNGNDTLLLAELVGAEGRVWAFDIQAEAISRTAQRLAEAGMADRVKLVHGGHEAMVQHVASGLSAVLFNLGYLPGGDRSVVTRPETTLPALRQGLELLRAGGILAVTIYPGHGGGDEERRSVDDWAFGLDPRSFHVWRMGQMNVPADAPYFILVQKAD